MVTSGDGRTISVRRAALRAAGRAARAAIIDRERELATARVVARVASLPAVVAARRVLLTRAVGDELDLAALEQRLVAGGVVISLPVVAGHELLAVDVVGHGTTRPGWRGVPEPVGDPTTAPVDVVVVPALVLDRRGGRLGYGGGHFDRFLGDTGRGATALSIGAVFHAQLVEHVPTLDHDVALDVVVTEHGVWRPGRGRPHP